MVYAVLTDEGHSKLRDASESHVAQIEEYFNARYDDEHLVELTSLLARIEPPEAGDCVPG